MKAVTVMPILLLQKPRKTPADRKGSNNHYFTLCRLKSWLDGDLSDLLAEGKTRQRYQPRYNHKQQNNSLAHSFANLVFEGKISAATRLLSVYPKGSLLHLDDTFDNKSVKENLLEKQLSHPDSLSSDTPPDCHPVLFESIDGSLIRSTALRTSGAAGPSGLDAFHWRRLCSSFKSASLDLCHSLASVARRLCSNFVDPKLVAPFLASRLIALEKTPVSAQSALVIPLVGLLARPSCPSLNVIY